MKRILTAAILTIAILVGTVAPVSATEHTVNQKDYQKRLESNIKQYNAQKTDAYTINTYIRDPKLMGTEYYGEQNEIVDEITKGLTSDYEKAKVIAKWVYENVYYEYTSAIGDEYRAQGIPNWRIGTCMTYAAATSVMMRKAGLPAKSVIGDAKGPYGWQGHEWNFVYVDGRWVHVDSTWGEFDKTVEEWSRNHILGGGLDIESDWQGSLTVKDSTRGNIVYQAEQLPLFSSLPTDMGINPDNLYLDPEGTRKIDPKTWKLDYVNNLLWAKYHTVLVYLPTENGGREHLFIPVGEGATESFVEVEHGKALPPVAVPPKAGHTFIGWKELDSADGRIIGSNDKITKDLQLIAVYQKGNVSHKVTFNTNGGTAVKEVTTKAYTSIKRPADPTKKGYKFTGWYKDSANTQAWDFSKDIVSKNTTIYAGWLNQNSVTATGTSSTVLVNSIPTDFEAYTIDGNNYFKLRDLAQAVNNTTKNFEVTWDNAKNSINLLSETPYTPAGGELVKGDGKSKVATKSTALINKDGVKVSLKAYTIGGNNFFKLRDIAQVFNIGVTWDNATKTIGIDTNIGYVD